MRRADRCVTDVDRLKQILSVCKVCRIAMVDNGKPYVIPLSFGYVWEENNPTFYFHCASEGRKIDILKMNADICFEVDFMRNVIGDMTADNACSFSVEYASIVANGKAIIVTEPEERLRALSEILFHQTGRLDWGFNDDSLSKTVVVRIDVTTLTGKTNYVD